MFVRNSNVSNRRGFSIATLSIIVDIEVFFNRTEVDGPSTNPNVEAPLTMAFSIR